MNFVQLGRHFRSSAELARSVEIDSETAPVLELALQMLDSNREPRTENVSGPIIALRDEGMEYATATVSTAGRGQLCEVHVTVRGDDVARAHDWFKDHETVISIGDVAFTPGKGLLMTDPAAFQLLADTILPDSLR